MSDTENNPARVAGCGLAAAGLLAATWWLNTRFNLVVQVTAPGAWALTVALIAGFFALIGLAVRGRATAILIDARNRISLSRLQAVAWTLVVLPAIITLTGWRGHNGLADPMSFDIPNDLVLAMGIAATTLIGAPILLSLRASQTGAPASGIGQQAAPPSPAPGVAPAPSTGSYDAAAIDVADKTGRGAANAAHAGAVIGWNSIDCAQWLDLFRGEEVGDGHTVDLAKVQQFLITLVLLAAYAAALWSFFAQGNGPGQPLHVRPPGSADKFDTTLPLLSTTFVWLLGVSHVGYLVAKATPSTPKPAPATGS